MQRKNIRLSIITALVVAALITVLQVAGLWRPVGIVLDSLVTPINRTLSGIFRGIGDGWHTLTTLGRLSTENRRLERQATEQQAEISRLKEVEHENELLRQQLNFQKSQSLSLVGASVTAYEPDNIRHALVIDRGSNDGVQVDEAVVSSGVFIGRVQRVLPRSAVIFLVTDPEFRVQAMSQSERARGIVRGQIGSGLRFEQIAQSETVDQGENVLTAGSDKVPRGLLIGGVDSVAQSDNEVFQAAGVLSPLNFARLEVVFVVKAK
ncbi:rod shape-determining protein MreC [bacterium]|nr:rod shape-determining protein MreC [bacterium]